MDELNNKEDSPGEKSKVLRLQKEIAKLEIQETENAMEAYQELVSSFNAIPSLIGIYFSEQLNNDKEAQRLGQEYNEAKKKLINLAVEHNVRLKEKLDQLKKEIASTGFYQRLGQEYNETKEKLINLAVEHNVRLKEKLDQLKKEIVATGFYELDREISDNKIVGQLGYRTPETNYIRFYKSDDKELRVPNQLLGLYEEALRKREAVKCKKPKSGLLSKLMK